MNIKRAFILFEKPIIKHSTIGVAVLLLLSTLGFLGYNYLQTSEFRADRAGLTTKLASTSAQLADLKKQDQYKINQDLKAEIKNINETYQHAVSSYQNLLDLKELNSKLDRKYDTQFAKALNQLSDKDYTSASATLADLDKGIQTEKDKLAPPPPAAPTAAVSNTPPGSGYNRQSVQTDRGAFTVDIVSADLNSTKVIVDTASDSDCRDNCPVLALGDYVSRSGAFAGINGSFFCPASYPQCAGKTNSFDTLVMNKNKHYLNSDNNVYSTVPEFK